MHSIFPPSDDCISLLSDPEEDFQPCKPSGLDLPNNLVVNLLSPSSSVSKVTSNPASPGETLESPLQSTSKLTTTLPDVATSLSTGLKISNLFPENNQSATTQNLPPFNSLLSDVRPLLSRPITSNFSRSTLFLDVNNAVSTTLTAQKEQNDPLSINICNTM